jgi:hypothetical protein
VLQAGLAFLASTFLQTSAPATTLGFFIFILGFIVQVSPFPSHHKRRLPLQLLDIYKSC